MGQREVVRPQKLPHAARNFALRLLSKYKAAFSLSLSCNVPGSAEEALGSHPASIALGLNAEAACSLSSPPPLLYSFIY